MLLPHQSDQADWKAGDRIVHRGKPEWGVGDVTDVVRDTHEGRPCLRVSARFARAGLKTLSTAFASLGRADERPAVSAGGSGWLAQATEGEDKEIMCGLPEGATDPFAPESARLRFSLALYRFTGSGGSLIDWAAVQSGLDDPLSRFNRHELEEFFGRFRANLDNHVRKLAAEIGRTDGAAVARELAAAPPAAQQALRGFNARR